MAAPRPEDPPVVALLEGLRGAAADGVLELGGEHPELRGPRGGGPVGRPVAGSPVR